MIGLYSKYLENRDFDTFRVRFSYILRDSNGMIRKKECFLLKLYIYIRLFIYLYITHYSKGLQVLKNDNNR